MEMEVVCDGLRFPEGPVAMADGSVIVVEVQGQALTRVTPDGRWRRRSDMPLIEWWRTCLACKLSTVWRSKLTAKSVPLRSAKTGLPFSMWTERWH